MGSSKVMKATMKKTTAMKAAKRSGNERLTKTGQHTPCGDGCISTSLKGAPCKCPRVRKGVPYCKRCMTSGDPSLSVRQHPKYGKILIAARNLPKGYHVAWWGAVKTPKTITEKAMEWALETGTKQLRYIDATPFKGSQLQFTACPGPSEVTTIDFSKKPADDCLIDIRESKSCLLFATLRDIPKSHQFTMMYNKDEKTTDEFFRDMGFPRADVGTAKYPALRKASKRPAQRAKKAMTAMKAIKK